MKHSWSCTLSLPWTTSHVHSVLAPPPYPSEGGLVLLIESAIVFAVFHFSFLI